MYFSKSLYCVIFVYVCMINIVINTNEMTTCLLSFKWKNSSKEDKSE